MFSPGTLGLFKQLLDQTQVSAAADDFEAMAAVVSLAKRELKAAMERGGVVVVDAPAAPDAPPAPPTPIAKANGARKRPAKVPANGRPTNRV